MTITQRETNFINKKRWKNIHPVREQNKIMILSTVGTSTGFLHDVDIYYDITMHQYVRMKLLDRQTIEKKEADIELMTNVIMKLNQTIV